MISAVAEMYGIHPQTLRLYEREGLLKPSRTEGNTRLYTDEDLQRLEFILSLARDLGVNISGMAIILQMRERMEEMQRQIQEFVQYIQEEVLTRASRRGRSVKGSNCAGKEDPCRADPEFSQEAIAIPRRMSCVVILSEVLVREADDNAVEEPHTCLSPRRPRKAFSLPRFLVRALARNPRPALCSMTPQYHGGVPACLPFKLIYSDNYYLPIGAHVFPAENIAESTTACWKRCRRGRRLPPSSTSF